MRKYHDFNDEEVVKLAKEGDEVAFSEIFERYKGIVRARAKTYYIAGGDYDDIIQEGMIGFFNAVRNFKPEMGYSFGTFAGICVERRIATAIRLALNKKNSLLNSSVPISIQSDSNTVNLAGDPESIIIDKENAEGTEFQLRGSLSKFENIVFDMLLDEKKYAEIAEILCVSKKSVDNAIQRIKRKMKLIKDEEITI